MAARIPENWRGRAQFASIAVLVVIMMAMTAGRPNPRSVTIGVGNRLYPNFHEEIVTKMHKREQIADTEYHFEVTDFYPHFAMTDSTRKFISLSDEPKNPAFRIKVYKAKKLVDETWAFFGVKIPHYARESFLTFEVIAFEYRGVSYRQEEEQEKGEDKDSGEEKEPE